MKLAVIGAGAAGTSAAWTAARAGAEVHALYWRAGTTELYSGAIDMGPGQHVDCHPLRGEVTQFAHALGNWSLPERGCLVATSLGIIRPSIGVQSPLLDLGGLAGRHIAVADVPRDGWDGPALARALSDTDWAQRTHTRFSSIALDVLDEEGEARIGAYDFARLFDTSDRQARLAAELRRNSTGVEAWLFGPWLGVEADLPSQLRAAAAAAVGETTSPLDGPAGARFVLARDRLFAKSGVRVHEGRVLAIRSESAGWTLEHGPDGSGGADPVTQLLHVDAVVLAVGGLGSGGVSQRGSPTSGTPFRLSLDAPVRFALDGVELSSVPSLHGPDWQDWGAGALERVGVVTEGARVSGAARLYAGGAVMANRPRSMLEAVRSGIAAARSAMEGEEGPS